MPRHPQHRPRRRRRPARHGRRCWLHRTPAACRAWPSWSCATAAGSCNGVVVDAPELLERARGLEPETVLEVERASHRREAAGAGWGGAARAGARECLSRARRALADRTPPAAAEGGRLPTLLDPRGRGPAAPATSGRVRPSPPRPLGGFPLCARPARVHRDPEEQPKIVGWATVRPALPRGLEPGDGRPAAPPLRRLPGGPRRPRRVARGVHGLPGGLPCTACRPPRISAFAIGLERF